MTCASERIDGVLRRLVTPGDLVDSRTIASLVDVPSTSHASTYLSHETARGRFDRVGKMVDKSNGYHRGSLFVYRVTDKFMEPRAFRSANNHRGGARNRSWNLPELTTLDASAVTVL